MESIILSDLSFFSLSVPSMSSSKKVLFMGCVVGGTIYNTSISNTIKTIHRKKISHQSHKVDALK